MPFKNVEAKSHVYDTDFVFFLFLSWCRVVDCKFAWLDTLINSKYKKKERKKNQHKIVEMIKIIKIN